VDEFLDQLTEQGFDEPVRSIYFFWVDGYIIEHKELLRLARDTRKAGRYLALVIAATLEIVQERL